MSDIRLCCSGLASILDARPGIEVVGAASTMHELLAHVEGAAVDVALLDVSPTREHLRTLRTVVEAERGARVVAVARSDSEVELLAWREAGAADVVGRGASLGELHAVLERTIG